MRKLPFVLAIALMTSALSATPIAADLRADDQVPPVPPGNSLPPPSTTPTPPTTSSTAQSSAGNKNGHFDKLKQQLGLTPAQATKIKPILERTAQQAKALRSSVSLSAAQKKQQIRQLHLATFEQIRPTLTPQQVQKWKQLREQHRGQAAQTAAN